MLYKLLGYTIYFWSGDAGEPVSRFTYTFVKAGRLKMQLKYGLGNVLF